MTIPDYKYDHLTFSEALEYLKSGRCISRPFKEYYLKLYSATLAVGFTSKCIEKCYYSDIAERTLSVNEFSIKSEDILADDWFLCDL